jgi:hypothetical protein
MEPDVSLSCLQEDAGKFPNLSPVTYNTNLIILSVVTGLRFGQSGV